jgi:hypothetical protein
MAQAAAQAGVRVAAAPPTAPSASPDFTATAEDVTVIVTTSPVASNPSTAMLACVVDALDVVPGLRGAKKLVVCDGVARVSEALGDGRPRRVKYKAALVDAEGARDYAAFVAAVHALAAERNGNGCSAAAHAAGAAGDDAADDDTASTAAGDAGGSSGRAVAAGRWEVLELRERHGFGWAVRAALALVDTEFVMVVRRLARSLARD